MAGEVAQRDGIADYGDFYLYYLREHAHPDCRKLHYVGTSIVLLCGLMLALTGNLWWLVAMPLAGYGFAWFAHFSIEKNRPATFRYPVWSLMSDFVMYFRWATGKIDDDLARAAIQEPQGG